MTRRAGIDVGGTKCLGVAIDDDAVVRVSIRRPTPPANELADLLVEMFGELGECASLGIGVPGLITPDGAIRASPNLRGATEIPLRAQLEERLNSRVWVDNDANCACLAEYEVGAARGFNDVWMVTLGTGIGGGLICGGSLQRGANGHAGEIGHMVVQLDGVKCPCGRFGCWERYASGSALSHLAGGERGESLIARATLGDPDAVAVVDEFAKWIAVGLANLTNLTDPSCIVLGGGLATSSDVLMPAVQKWFSEMLYSPQHRAHPRLCAAELGEHAGAIGAALLPTHE